MPPALERIDHVHVFVADRAAAQAWYARALGLQPVADLAFWAADGGPLTLADPAGALYVALFERPAQPCRSTIALAVTAEAFVDWQQHLSALLQRDVKAVDHEVSWSLYFSDPDGNPWELTCYEHAALAARLR